MQLIKNILLATDFLKSSENVLDTAIKLGQSFHSDISVIHVMSGEVRGKKNKLMLEEAANKNMERVVAQIEEAGLNVKKTYIRKGSCAEAVIRAASRTNASLIVLGSSEVVKKDAYKLGTTADKIIRSSEVPVWVVKKDVDFNIDKVFCPIDFSEQSRRALEDAANLAKAFNASLVVFSVNELDGSGDSDAEPGAEHEKNVNEFMDSIETSGLNHDVVIENGDPAAEILKGIERHQPDLLVMGTSGKSGLSRWLMGSVAEKVTREVPCSFITVKSRKILTLELEHRVMDLEYHYQAAEELLEKGMYRESADAFRACLKINDMHIPSLAGIAKAYDKLGETESAENFRKMARVTLSKMWDEQIEAEIRNHYSL